VILFLGRLHPIKGVDLLIRAFEIVSKEIDNCVLVIAGPDDGSLSGLKALAEELNLCEKVLFTGPLYDKEKFAVYRDSDIYVLPSYYETFPMTVLEAWEFKMPVVVTENCGIKDLVHDSGQVVQPNPYDLAAALREYLQLDSLRYRHGQNGYNKLHESLSIQATVENIFNIYQDVIKSRGIKRLS
jgi:glycosyltransferase involved in cell wall biosynthesis